LVVFFPPWADELNKSRRMVRLQSEQLAGQGFAVLQVDLTGCGDSSGEHGDARWSQWLEDALDGLQWLAARYAPSPVVFWGLRSGCLLACEAAAKLGGAVSLLFWNPPNHGKLVWQQFTRLATAAALTGDAGKVRAEAVKRGLAQRQTVEIAGYEVHPLLYEGLSASVLKAPARLQGAAMIETTAQPGPDLTPALALTVEQWRRQGVAVHAARVQGPAFWQTTEIEDAPALCEATLQVALALVGATNASGR
jgi:uncharacterized protein